MAQQPLTLTRSNTQQTTSVSPLDDESSPQNDNSQEHVNTLTNTPYSASNQALLEMHAMQFALNSHQWAGFRQWLTLGRQVKKGEKGCAIMMVCEKKEEENDTQQEESETKKRRVVKTIYVFNKEQTQQSEDEITERQSATKGSKAKSLATFGDVTKALAEGYISPLNHDQKRPEPTPPTDETKSRKAASLGDYQERIESKKARLAARAEKAQHESNSRFENAHQLGNVLPFGQPILVGHHSENKHR